MKYDIWWLLHIDAADRHGHPNNPPNTASGQLLRKNLQELALNALKGGHFAFCVHPQKEHTDIGHNVELQQMQIDETQLTIKGLLETIT